MSGQKLSVAEIDNSANIEKSESASETKSADNKPKQFQMPQTLERYEIKYTIPTEMMDEIEYFLMPYCSFDNYSTKTPGGFYKVNSLYFDTPEFLFLRKRMMKCENRFNMRIRSYGDFPVPPYFLEIKQRRGDTVRKFRSKCNDNFLKELTTSSILPVHMSDEPKERKNQELFINIHETYSANPVVLVQYLRKAFVSEVDDYARVTFDRALRYMPQNTYNVFPDEPYMIPCDNETIFDGGCNVILELKCYTSIVPKWMLDLVKKFQLNRRGFSKYSNCMRPVFERYSNKDLFARESTFEYEKLCRL